MKTRLYLVIALLICSLTPSMAQQPESAKKFTPEERAQHKAELAAQKILLSDADAAKFIPVYKAYVMENHAIALKYKQDRPQRVEGQLPPVKTDAQIDAEIRAQFKKSHEILALREAYYEKFLKLVSPRQIRELYKFERQNGEKARQRHPGGRK